MQKYAWPKSGILQELFGKGCSHRVPSMGGRSVLTGGYPDLHHAFLCPFPPLSLAGLCRSQFTSHRGWGEASWSLWTLTDTAFLIQSIFFYSCLKMQTRGCLCVCWSAHPFFLPVVIRSIIFCANLACSDTATLERQIRFDKFRKTQFAKSCLDVQESHFYWAVLNTSTWI